MAPLGMVTVPSVPGKVSAVLTIGMPVNAGQTDAQGPVQVGEPPLVSPPYVYTTKPLASARTQPRLERCTIRTVVPFAGRPTAPEGRPPAVGVELEVPAVDDDDDDDDPPHAVSSSTSEASPAAATAHPLLRITSPFKVPWDFDPIPDTPERYQTAEPPGGYLAAT